MVHDAMSLVTLLYVLLFGSTLAIPAVSYPFNSQVPPVARVGALYDYTLPSNTFSGYLTDVVYSLTNAPAWMKVDSGARRLYGIPAAADAGYPSFGLLATDSTGAATDPITLVVASSPAPYISKPLEAQLQALGSVDGRGGLIIAPNTRFTIPFARDTFAETGGNVTAYYGTSDNYTPLPSWIFFDAQNIVFTGTAPPVVSPIAPPQYFEFVLVGSDYVGFAGVSATFQIVVGTHQLAFSTVQYTREAALNTQFTFQIPLESLLLDGASIPRTDIVSATANTTGTFLSFDTSTLTLTGIPLENSQNTSVVVTVIDVYGDAASLNLQVNFGQNGTQGTVFTQNLPPIINATAGSFFSYTFNATYVPTAAELNVTISGASWLHYNSQNRTLYGLAPSTQIAKRQTSPAPSVTIVASQDGQSQAQTFTVNLVPASASPTSSSRTAVSSGSSSTLSSTDAVATASQSSSSTATQPDASSTASVAAAPASSHRLSQRQKLAIGLGVSLPILAILAALLLICCCCIGRRRKSTKGSPVPSNISHPINNEKDEWPRAGTATNSYDEPRQIGAFQMFKSTSEGRLSGYAVEVTNNAELAPPLAPIALLPPLPDSPSFDAVRSAYGSDSGSRSDPLSNMNTYRSNERTLSVNNSISNVQASSAGRYPQKSITSTPSSIPPTVNRDSTNTVDTVSTDELFSVRLVDARNADSIAPPIKSDPTSSQLALPTVESNLFARRQLMSNSTTQNSGHTIGTYTSSEGGHIQRYGSQGESLSSGAHSRGQLSRNDSNAPQPWRVMQSQGSYGSFGSYATTDSNLSDEFSFDESLSGGSNETGRRVFDQRIAEEPEEDEPQIRHARQTVVQARPGSDSRLLEAPLSPDWNTLPKNSMGVRPTLNERVVSTGKAKLMETSARRPMSSASIGTPDTSAETSGEIAFV